MVESVSLLTEVGVTDEAADVTPLETEGATEFAAVEERLDEGMLDDAGGLEVSGAPSSDVVEPHAMTRPATPYLTAHRATVENCQVSLFAMGLLSAGLKT
jgi:hypothetical protein